MCDILFIFSMIDETIDVGYIKYFGVILNVVGKVNFEDESQRWGSEYFWKKTNFKTSF